MTAFYRAGAALARPAAMLLALVAAAFLSLLATPGAALAQGYTPQRFTVEVAGQGPDVILIPGLATPRDVWRPVADGLEAGHRVHLVQLRGFGDDAGANGTGPVLEPVVAELARYIEGNGMEKPAVIGHSMGGLMALMLGADHPALPGQLVIVDSLPWFGALMAPAGAGVDAVEPQARMLRDIMVASHGQPVMPNEAAVTGYVLDKRSVPLLMEWQTRIDQRVAGWMVYGAMTTDMRQRIGAITAPLTVIYPFNDAAAPTQAQAEPVYRANYAAAPATRFVGMANAAHFLMLDQPVRTLAVLEGLLAE